MEETGRPELRQELLEQLGQREGPGRRGLDPGREERHGQEVAADRGAASALQVLSGRALLRGSGFC